MNGFFNRLHPWTQVCYFALVLIVTMLCRHPVVLGLSFLMGAALSLHLGGTRAVRTNLVVTLPVLVLTALMNPLFSHEGATILRWLPWGNPLPLESLVYGGVSALMLGASVCWFYSFGLVFTTDRLMCVLGSALPSLSMVLAMTLRFVPLFIRRFKVTWQAQKALGGTTNTIKLAGTVLSCTLGWALENAGTAAGSMRCRGCGLPGRTAYSSFRFTRRDLIFSAAAALGGLLIAVSGLMGGLSFRYYPVISGDLSSPAAWLGWVGCAILCLCPLGADILEERRWKSLRSAT